MERQMAVLALAAVLLVGHASVRAEGNATAPAAAQTPAAQAPAPPAGAPAPIADQLPPVVIDPKILARFDAEQAKLQSAKSLTAVSHSVVTYSLPGQAKPPVHQQSDIELMRPNYASLTTWQMKLSPTDGTWQKSDPSMIQMSDGSYYWLWMGSNNVYRKTASDPAASSIMRNFEQGLNGFFSDKLSLTQQVTQMNAEHLLSSAELKENQSWNGSEYSVVELTLSIRPPRQMANTVTGDRIKLVQDFYIGHDNLVHRFTLSASFINEDETFDSFKLDPKLDKTAFNFTPPAGSTLFKPAPPAVQTPLLANGSTAPDFAVQDQNGKSVKLSDYQGKVVVIDFWATWCGPCQASLPHTNQVAEKFKGKDVVFLAVNTSDTSDAFKAWLPQHKDYDALNFVIDSAPSTSNVASTLYHVTGIPTQFVIDKTGKVTNSFVGYGGPNDDLENAVKAAGG